MGTASFLDARCLSDAMRIPGRRWGAFGATFASSLSMSYAMLAWLIAGIAVMGAIAAFISSLINRRYPDEGAGEPEFPELPDENLDRLRERSQRKRSQHRGAA